MNEFLNWSASKRLDQEAKAKRAAAGANKSASKTNTAQDEALARHRDIMLDRSTNDLCAATPRACPRAAWLPLASPSPAALADANASSSAAGP